MDVKMAMTQFHNIRQACYYNHNIQTFASVVSLFEQSSAATKTRQLVCSRFGRAAASSFNAATRIPRSRSCELMIIPERRRIRPLLRRVYSAGGGSADHHGFSEEEFLQHLQELALNFNPAQESEDSSRIIKTQNSELMGVFSPVSIAPAWTDFRPPHFPLTEESHVPPPSGNIELKGAAAAAHSLTRMIEKKKKRKEEEDVPKGKSAAGLMISESAVCSVKKAFSSMVFMIRELQSYILQIREQLFLEDLRGILTNVQKEIQASFVWLFQQVFSCTPTLMVYVMILLANFTVYSMDHNAALAAAPPPATVTVIEINKTTTTSTHSTQLTEPYSRKFSIPASSSSFSSTGKNNNILSIGGGSGGAGKSIPVAGGTDGSGGDQINVFDPFSSTGGSSSSTVSAGGDHDQVITELSKEEAVVWNSVTEEAAKMKAEVRGTCLNDETVRQFVSPVVVNPVEEVAVAPVAEYFKRELVYQDALAQDPNNSLLLSNYAQFLFLVVHDHDRAEEYFKRAAVAKPIDAEALNRYAKFLWLAKNDMNAAEETFLEALAIEPGNAYYAGDYASFLWKTGGEDTCFPLDAPDHHQNSSSIISS